MPALKRLRHEMFAREYIRAGENATQAYLKTHEVFPGKPLVHYKSAQVVSSVILKRPEVKHRIRELRNIMAKKSDITLDKVLTDIEEAIVMAKAQAKPNDLVNAAVAQAKLVGLMRERVESGNVGDFDGIEDISEVLAKVAEEAGPEAALALSRAFGFDNAVPSPEPVDELTDAKPASDAVN